jgi:L-alanine-DL-glutamate epimerase-like enolase superfamily enzyme
LGPGCEIRLDANGTWSLATAASVLHQLEEIRPSYCEDPVAAPNEVPALRAHTSVQVAADGWLQSESARESILNERWAEVVVLKPAVLGGLIPSLRLARRAKEKGMGVVVTTLLEGTVARQAALHLACAIQSPLAHGLSTGTLLQHDYAEDVAPVRAGMMALSPRFGLGVEVRA